MMISNVKSGFEKWMLLLGVMIGVAVTVYLSFNGDNPNGLSVFVLIFFPMLFVIGVAALVNLFFYFATGRVPQKYISGIPTNEEFLSRVPLGDYRIWFVKGYRFLQPIAMIGVGYITTCPIIGIFFLK